MADAAARERADDDAPLLQVVLVAPEIATNTGNIIRLCANTGAALHLVEPLGFDLDDDRGLRRAGLDYHELADVHRHRDLDACLRVCATAPVYALTSRGARRHDEVAWRVGDTVVFGAERAGLGDVDLARFPAAHQVRIPMRPGNRSLNLANAVAVVAYEAWRQVGFAARSGEGRAGGAVGTIAERPDGAAW